MGEASKVLQFNHEDTVPTYTIGAAFTLATVLGLIVVSGVLLKPYEAREVVKSLHERILEEKENRDLARVSYTGGQLAASKTAQSAIFDSGDLSKSSYAASIRATSEGKLVKKTDRAQSFDRDVKSDAYWKNLQASITGVNPLVPNSAPVVLPSVVVGAK